MVRQKSIVPGIILELKADGTPEEAIRQIRDKEYHEKLKKVSVEKEYNLIFKRFYRSGMVEQQEAPPDRRHAPESVRSSP